MRTVSCMLSDGEVLRSIGVESTLTTRVIEPWLEVAELDAVWPIERTSLTDASAETPAESQAEWKQTADKQVEALTAFAEGWDGHEALPIAPAVLYDARLLVARFAKPGVPPPSVVPGVNGTVQLEWHTRSCDAEIEILEPGRYAVFTRPVMGGEPWEGETDLNEAVARIEQVLLA